jgi:hypothetical protein
MTIERRINQMIDAGYNVFMLRWKKLHPYKTSIFGFEIVDAVSRNDPSTGEVTYLPQIRRGELKFFPDESLPETEQVPIAYVADTPYNRTILRNQFYSSPYIIGSLIGPSGSKSGQVIRAEIEKEAVAAGIAPRAKNDGSMKFTFGRVSQEQMHAMIQKKILGKNVQPAEKTAEATDKSGRTVVVKPARQLGVTECKEQAEANILEKFDLFAKQMQKQYGPHWRKSKPYKDTFVQAIQDEYERLLTENGHTVVKPASPIAPEPEAVNVGEPEPAEPVAVS